MSARPTPPKNSMAMIDQLRGRLVHKCPECGMPLWLSLLVGLVLFLPAMAYLAVWYFIHIWHDCCGNPAVSRGIVRSPHDGC